MLAPNNYAAPFLTSRCVLMVEHLWHQHQRPVTLNCSPGVHLLQIALANSEHSDSSFLRTVAGYFTHLPQPSDAALHTTLRDYLVSCC